MQLPATILRAAFAFSHAQVEIENLYRRWPGRPIEEAPRQRDVGHPIDTVMREQDLARGEVLGLPGAGSYEFLSARSGRSRRSLRILTIQAMTSLAAAVRSLNAKLAVLATGTSCPGDWVRLDAAATRAALVARHELSVDELACDELAELLDELRYIKLCAQAGMLERSGHVIRR